MVADECHIAQGHGQGVEVFAQVLPHLGERAPARNFSDLESRAES